MDTSYTFPPEIVSPKTKEKPEYGLQLVKAMYYCNNVLGFRNSSDFDEFQSMIDFSQGRQSMAPVRQLLGFRQKPGVRPEPDTPEALAQIDPQVLNMAPKYINKAVAKMQRQNYEISLESIDLVSLEEKDVFAAQVQAFYKMKGWVQSMGIPLQNAFSGLDIGSLPQYPDELLYDLTVNPKIDKEIKGEMALQMILWTNRWQQKQREVDWDLVVHGIGHLHVYHDHNMRPRVDHLNPKYVYGSWVDNDDFEGREYAYFVECISVNQLIREASRFMDQRKLESIKENYGVKNMAFNANLFDRTITDIDNITYIPVVRFYALSEDNRSFVTRPTQYGGTTIFERDFSYLPTEKSKERFNQDGDSKLSRVQATSVYGGTWIMDSDIVYDYGRKPYPRTDLVNLSLPIKTAATNFKNGRAVSFAAQLVEPVLMMNVAWSKAKIILGRGRAGMRSINFDALENVMMGHGGEAWTPQEVYRYLEMSDDLISRGGATNAYGGTMPKGVEFTDTGVDLASYFTTINLCINFMENLTGTPIAETTNVPDRVPAAAVNASKLSSDLDMEYLYNARQYLFERTANQLLLLTQESKRRGVSIRGYVPSFGKWGSGYHEISEEIAYTDYGMRLSKQAGPEEWAEFYLDVREMLKLGRLGASDSAFLREIDNLKQARQMLAIREKQYMRQVAQEKMRDNQMMMESNVTAAEAKMNAEMAVLDKEKKDKAELLALESKYKMALQDRKSQDDRLTKQIIETSRRAGEKDKITGEILKTGVRNQADFDKNATSERNTMVKAEVDIHKAEQQAKKPAAK